MPRCYVPEAARFSQLMIDSNLTVGLLSAPPTPSYGGTELNTTNAPGYARQLIVLSAGGNMCAGNLNAPAFTLSGNWPLCEYFGIFDATNTMQYWGMLNVPLSSKLDGSATTQTIPPGGIYVDWLNNANSLLPNFGRPPTPSQSIGPTGVTSLFCSQMMPITSLPSGPLTSTTLTGSLPVLPSDYLPLASLMVSAPQLPATAMALPGGINAGSSGSASSTTPIVIRYGRPAGSYLANFASPVDGISMPLINNVYGRPRDHNVFLQRTLTPEPQLGFFSRRRMVDATRGTTAGFTENGPNSLAF